MEGKQPRQFLEDILSEAEICKRSATPPYSSTADSGTSYGTTGSIGEVLVDPRYSAKKIMTEDPTHYVLTSLQKSSHVSGQILGPRDAYDMLHKDYEGEQREIFKALYLNTKNYILSLDIISIGSLNASIVHPREILRPAIQNSAASMLLAHNHPSGDPTPSREDSVFTKRMAKCGELIGIQLLDHIIVGEGSYISLKERGDF